MDIVVKIDVPSPKDAAEYMRGIMLRGNNERVECHRAMDNYLLDILKKLGYAEAVAIFYSTPKWYG